MQARTVRHCRMFSESVRQKNQCLHLLSVLLCIRIAHADSTCWQLLLMPVSWRLFIKNADDTFLGLAAGTTTPAQRISRGTYRLACLPHYCISSSQGATHYRTRSQVHDVAPAHQALRCQIDLSLCRLSSPLTPGSGRYGKRPPGRSPTQQVAGPDIRSDNNVTTADQWRCTVGRAETIQSSRNGYNRLPLLYFIRH